MAKYFELAILGTNWRTETLVGCTTFPVMSETIFVNPSILAATLLSAGLASISMGTVAR